MIMTRWDTIAHTSDLRNLSFVDNPDLNIELRLAFSVLLAFIDQRSTRRSYNISLFMFAFYISQIFGIFKARLL